MLLAAGKRQRQECCEKKPTCLVIVLAILYLSLSPYVIILDFCGPLFFKSPLGASTNEAREQKAILTFWIIILFPLSPIPKSQLQRGRERERERLERDIPGLRQLLHSHTERDVGRQKGARF